MQAKARVPVITLDATSGLGALFRLLTYRPGRHSIEPRTILLPGEGMFLIHHEAMPHVVILEATVDLEEHAFDVRKLRNRPGELIE